MCAMCAAACICARAHVCAHLCATHVYFRYMSNHKGFSLENLILKGRMYVFFGQNEKKFVKNLWKFSQISRDFIISKVILRK